MNFQLGLRKKRLDVLVAEREAPRRLLSVSHFHLEYALGSEGVTRTPIISEAVAAGADR